MGEENEPKKYINRQDDGFWDAIQFYVSLNAEAWRSELNRSHAKIWFLVMKV